MTAASGDQTIAHGLGRIPKYVRMTAVLAFSQGGNFWVQSVGTYRSGNTTCVVLYYTDSGIPAAFNDTTNFIYLREPGPKIQYATVAIDATNITLSWTKSGSPSGTAYLMWECW